MPPIPDEVKSKDMTVEEFYSGFNLDFLTEKEKQTIYTATELFAKGKVRQQQCGISEQDLKAFESYFDYFATTTTPKEGYKDAGNSWIAFTDKWNAFKKKLATPCLCGRYKDLLQEIDKSLYIGEDLKDGEILSWYMEVIKTIKEEIQTALNK